MVNCIAFKFRKIVLRTIRICRELERYNKDLLQRLAVADRIFHPQQHSICGDGAKWNWESEKKKYGKTIYTPSETGANRRGNGMRPGCTTSVRPNTNLAMKQTQKLNYIYASITFFTTFSKLFTIFIDFHFYFFLSLL